MRLMLLAGALVAGLVVPAAAETWTPVHEGLEIEVDTLLTREGYTLFKTRQVDKGKVAYQHKEAIHCGDAKHFFRGMYDAAAKVDNRNDADLKWTDWKQNPREAWNIDRLYAIKTFVCAKAKK